MQGVGGAAAGEGIGGPPIKKWGSNLFLVFFYSVQGVGGAAGGV